MPHSLHLPPLFTTFYHLYCHSTLFTPKLQVGIVDFFQTIQYFESIILVLLEQSGQVRFKLPESLNL